MKVSHRLAFVSLSILCHACNGDFGDFVDLSFDCPATTTCAQICVSSADLCPSETSCPNGTLCADGSCSDNECDPDLENPCEENECFPVACNRVIRTYDLCTEEYGPLYEEAAECAYGEGFTYNFSELGFVIVYIWVVFNVVSVILWCFYNQKGAPVEGSCKALTVGSQITGEGTKTICYQTGYKTHPIGVLLHYHTLATIAGFHAVLAWLTIQYYVTNEAPEVANLTMYFEDEENLLKAFICVWTIGLFWSFVLKWPISVASLFYRRCLLAEATHVAVFLGTSKIERESAEEVALSVSWLGSFKNMMTSALASLDSAMAFLFSEVDCFALKGGLYKFCPVGKDSTGERYFVFVFRRYNYNTTGSVEAFEPHYLSIGETLGEINKAGSNSDGLSKGEVESRRRVVGRNSIEMPTPFFLKVMQRELSKPFYTYQAFLIWSWFPLYYYYMACVWLIVVFSGAFTVAAFQYKNERNVHRLTHVDGRIAVFRDGSLIQIDPEDLVPGDVVKVGTGTSYCDMVLIGNAIVLVDESALTGESTPQMKVPVDPVDSKQTFDIDVHKRHTISAGTVILESDDEACAVVIRTGSYTAKGELLRQIFSFQRHKFKFDWEVGAVLGILFLYAVFGFCMVIYFTKDTPVYGFFYGLYVVATVLPPLLPTVFTVSVGISDNRLASKRVASVNPESILIAGKVTHAFFDKTGTLTKQGLDFLHAKSVESWESENVSADVALCMACCHILTQSKKGVLIGNPVDKTMFEASGSTIAAMGKTQFRVTDKNGKRAEVLRRFDFDHHRMTQSVIVKLDDGGLLAFVKGSAESMKSICEKTSIPADFSSVVNQNAAQGMYQIVMGMKHLPATTVVEDLARDEVEGNVSLIGLLNFKNVIRPETPDVINQLTQAEISCTMLTGDSVETGVVVARQAGIIPEASTIKIGKIVGQELSWTTESDEPSELDNMDSLQTESTVLALTGEAWDMLRKQKPKEAIQLAHFVRVYGRCTPNNKITVIESFVERGVVSLMCGDGGNDCGALKTAHVGVALSDSEASIVAPFTSIDKAIGSVVEVVREGRCALASALASYKFIIFYGQIETINQLINAYFLITFTEWCWVWMDGTWTIIMAFTLPLAKAAQKLSNTRPTASILGAQTVASVLGIMAVNFLFTVIGLFYLFGQDWFSCRMWGGADLSNALVIGDNYESEVIWLVTGFQYFASAMALNFGYEFRESWYKNYWFVFFSMAFLVMHFYVTLVPGKLSCFWRVNCDNENVVIGVTDGALPIQNPFNTTVMPVPFRWGLIGIMTLNLICIMCYEYYVVNGIRRKLAAKKRESKTAAVSMPTFSGTVEKDKSVAKVETTVTDARSGFFDIEEVLA